MLANPKMHSKRIAITGIGVVSPLGQEPAEFWRHLLEDSDRMSEVVPQRMGQASFQGTIDDFGDVPQYLDRPIRKALKLMNRETQMGVVAGERALLESEVTTHYDPERIGVCFGADNVSIKPEDFQSGVAACTNSEGAFELGAWGTQGLTEVAPLWLLKCLPNMPACHLGILNDLRGPSNTITQRDVAANLAIAEACRIIKDDDADAMVVGALGTSLPVFNLMHARLEEEVSQDSTVFCSPFDKRHTGLAPGEGAAALVLEELSSALSRGAEIYGEILGMGSASVIGHDGAACGRALVRAMRQMFRQVRVAPESIGHIHAHGLGTKTSDVSEACAIQEVFSGPVPVVTATSHLGHAGVGSGAMEIIASLMALREGRLFPARHFRELDPACPIRLITDNATSAGTSFLNLNFFGRGLASCVAVGAYQG